METTTPTEVANLPGEGEPFGLQGARLIALMGSGAFVSCLSGGQIAEASPTSAEEVGWHDAARTAPAATTACIHMVLEARKNYTGRARGTY